LISLAVYILARADAASKVRGAISEIFVGHYGFSSVRWMKYTSQHCCDETMDGNMALYRDCCFPNCTKSWWIKLLT